MDLFSQIGRIDILGEKMVALYEKAPAASRVSAALALVVGCIGILCLAALCVVYYRDKRAIAAARRANAACEPPQATVMSHALSRMYKDGKVDTKLSHDAAMGYIQSRVDSWISTSASITRLFSYLPLLIGLMGTMLGLADMLQNYPTGGGQKAAMEHLDAVFAGTLFGILGSLIGTLSMVLGSALMGSITSEIEGYVHDFILPLVTPPALTVRIEDFVEPVREKVQEAMGPFVTLVDALGVGLAAHAESSKMAAEQATEAFRSATSAASKASVFDDAAAHFANSASSVVASGRTLGDLARSTQELAEATNQLGSKILDAGSKTSDLATAATTMSEKVAGAAGKLEESTSTMSTQSAALSASVERLDETCRRIEKTNDVLSTEVAVSQNVMRGLADTTAEKINQDFKSRIDAICKTLESTLNLIRKPIDEAASALQVEQARLLESGKTAQDILPQLDARLVSLTQELAGMTAAMEGLLSLRENPAFGGNERTAVIDDEPRKRDMDRLFVELKQHFEATQEIQSVVKSRMPIPEVKESWMRNPFRRKKPSVAAGGDG